MVRIEWWWWMRSRFFFSFVVIGVSSIGMRRMSPEIRTRQREREKKEIIFQFETYRPFLFLFFVLFLVNDNLDRIVKSQRISHQSWIDDWSFHPSKWINIITLEQRPLRHSVTLGSKQLHRKNRFNTIPMCKSYREWPERFCSLLLAIE